MSNHTNFFIEPKKSGKLIGTITPTGLVHKREKLDRSVMDHIDVLELGASGYLFQHNRVLQERLRECFPELWRELFAISVLRITEGPRFKPYLFKFRVQ